jgi:hypothetical protein
MLKTTNKSHKTKFKTTTETKTQPKPQTEKTPHTQEKK